MAVDLQNAQQIAPTILEIGAYKPGCLDGIVRHADRLGALARSFDQIADKRQRHAPRPPHEQRQFCIEGNTIRAQQALSARYFRGLQVLD
jgi:hypothetical protein